MAKIIKSRLQLKKDTSANWEKNNPVILDGEKIIVVTNAGEIREKIGDGTKTYTQLPFTDEGLKALIDNKVDKVSGKGLSTNDYTTTEKNKLAGIAEGANKYVHPNSHPATMITEDTTHRFVTDAEKANWNNKPGTSVASATANGLMSKDDKIKLDGIAEGANKYVHPTYTSKSSGLYKVTVDGTGHVSAATAVAKSDITGLGIPAQDTTYSEATSSDSGLMSSADKAKLDGIAEGANVYTHPSYTAKTSGLYKVTIDALGHVSATTAVAKSDITALGIPGTNTTYSDMTAATANTAGTHGLVPAPAKGQQGLYLRGDGTWATPTNTTYGDATTTAHGLMTAAMVTKLNGIATGANKYTHPTYTAKDSGLYKVTVDATGHVSATTAVAKSDITALGIPAQDTTYSVATTDANGLMSKDDKSKLDGIAANANNYSHPSYTAKSSGLYKVTVDSTGHVSATTAVAKSDITALGIPAQDTTYSDMKAATADAAGTHGLVPAPAAGKQSQYLRGDGTWATPTNTTYSDATTTAHGLMTAAMVTKLNGIADGANKTTVDAALSSTSTNPVQNKIINSALSGKSNTGHTHTKSEITDFPTSLKNPTALTIQLNGTAQDAYDGSTARTINITAGSIGAAASSHTHTAAAVGADAAGSADKALTSAKSYTDTKISDLINGAPETLDTLGEIATAMSENADVVTALQNAVGSKANTSDLTSHTGNTTVHITAAERTAWNAKASTSVATTSANGLMSSTMVTKLNGIAEGANKYVHPSYTAKTSGLYKITVDATGHVSDATAVAKSDITGLGIPAQDTTYSVMTGATSVANGASGLVPIPYKGKESSFLRGDGTWATPTNTTYSAMKGATTSAAGTAGLVPAPATGAANRYLRSDGTWQVPPDTNTTYSDATTSAHGLMTAAMVTKLNGIATGANAYTHPSYTAKTSGLYKITVDATGHVSAATAVAKSDITGLGIPAQDTTYSAMKAATADAAGSAGLVPAPAKGQQGLYLRGDGTWATPTNTTYGIATTSANGLMSSTMVTNLNSLLTRMTTAETTITNLTNKLKTAVFYE